MEHEVPADHVLRRRRREAVLHGDVLVSDEQSLQELLRLQVGDERTRRRILELAPVVAARIGDRGVPELLVAVAPEPPRDAPEAVREERHVHAEDDRQALLGLRGERDLIRSRITSRLKARLEEGMVDEIRGLLDSGVPSEILLRYGLEYKFVTLYLLGEIDYEEMFEKLNVAIHQFSKRQMTWFRRMERLGMDIHWIDVALPEDDKMEAIYHIIKDCGGTSLPQTSDH